MKKEGILNKVLAGNIAALGHKDMILIADVGMPIPKNIEIIDLALCVGIPTFQQVLKKILNEIEVEHYYIAEEICEGNKKNYDFINSELKEISASVVNHDNLKSLCNDIKFAIRTGEASPYCNIILRSGVIF